MSSRIWLAKGAKGLEIEEPLCYTMVGSSLSDLGTPELTESEREVMEGLVDVVVRHKLITPTILLLELLRPFSFLGSQCLLLLQPLLGPLSRETGGYASLLEDRAKVDKLLERLEQERRGCEKGG